MNNIDLYLSKVLDMRKSMLQGEGEYTWQDVVDLRTQYNMPNVCRDNVRKGFLFSDELMTNGWISEPSQETKNNACNYKETTQINSNGTLSSDKVIEINKSEINDPSVLLERHGFNPLNFELVSAKNSIWQQGTKDGTKNLYSSKITVKPIYNKLDLDYLDKYFETREFSLSRDTFLPVRYDPKGEILEIDVADLHLGLLAYGQENGGEDFDIKIAKEYFSHAFGDVIDRCKEKSFKKIVLVTMGDILHVNNDEGTTAKGTRQDTDSRLTKMFTEALDMLINAVETLEIISKVEVVYVAGNHDRDIGYMLIKALEKAFRNDENVSFNNTPNPRKAERFGKCLIGWCHGEMKNDKISEWLQTEYREDFGKSKFTEVHCGHTHCQDVTEKSGMVIRHVSNLCAASYWEHSQGYNKGIRAITSFVWNENTGLREVWYSSI